MWILNKSKYIRNILVVCAIYSLPYMYITLYLAAVVAQWVRAFAQAEGWVFDPSRDRPKSLKQEVTAPLQNSRH